jgi:hypothetical protein
VPLPLPLAAATHAASLLLTSNTAGICQSEVGSGGAESCPGCFIDRQPQRCAAVCMCVCVRGICPPLRPSPPTFPPASLAACPPAVDAAPADAAAAGLPDPCNG